jgi:DNA-binding response OmpR family regulator
MAKILLVESDPETARTSRDWLLLQGFAVDVASDGQHALQLLSEQDYDLILLDVQINVMSGTEVCRRYRSRNGCARILMYSAQDSVSAKTDGLDAGADDFIKKPYDLKEITARIRALMRRSLSLTGSQIVICDLVIDLPNHKVMRGNQEIQLQPQEFALLEYLMRNPDRLFSAEHLVKRVWRGISSVYTVRTHIKTLRKKIDLPELPALIKTVHGVGYGIMSSSQRAELMYEDISAFGTSNQNLAGTSQHDSSESDTRFGTAEPTSPDKKDDVQE